MKLPIQAAPIQRSASTGSVEGRVTPSGICEMLCDRLPEPARSICKAAC